MNVLKLNSSFSIFMELPTKEKVFFCTDVEIGAPNNILKDLFGEERAKVRKGL